MSTHTVDGVRCAPWTCAAGVDPIGSIDAYDAVIVIEWPLPWPAAAADIDVLAPLEKVPGTGRVRLQIAVPDRADRSRVTLYRRRVDAAGRVGRFARVERVTTPERAAETAMELLTTAAPENVGAPAVDVLICAHGRRDRCCGAAGTSLAIATGHRRTSHLGGHRFAPTGLVFPDATAWAYLDDAALERITARSGALADLLPHYRGFLGIDHPAAQPLERAAFAEIGWEWLDHHRQVRPGADGSWTLDAVAPDGAECAWKGVVGVRRSLPVPECGQPIESAKKTSDEYELVELSRVR